MLCTLHRIIFCNVFRFKFTSGSPKTLHEIILSVLHLIFRVVNNTETRFVLSCIQICLLKSFAKRRYICARTRSRICIVEHVIARALHVQSYNARSFVQSFDYSCDPIEWSSYTRIHYTTVAYIRMIYQTI